MFLSLPFLKFLAPAAAAALPVADPSPRHELLPLVGKIAVQASTIGRESAEVRGLLEDSGVASQRGAGAVAALGAQVGEVTQAQARIGAAAGEGLAAVERVRGAVEEVGREVGEIVATLRDVAIAAESITQIALQTRLVAFNASIEAKRAGDAGRGFGVVADAVKDLAGKVEQSSKDIMRTVALLDQRVGALAGEIRIDPARREQGAFQTAISDVQGAVASTRDAAAQAAGTCDGLGTQMTALAAQMLQTGVSLDAAARRSETLLDVSERLIELVAESGVTTEDTPCIDAVIEAAREIAVMLEAALARGVISAQDLFDEAYQAVPGTNPAQHMTAFTTLADKLFPAVQERLLALGPKVVFCIAVDRNGYVPTHNLKYNQPQRGDLAWDTANSRCRRIFNDRTGLASARNERPFLVQTYRRDMGGGQFVVMKEAAAPITVNGRHWGGLRLAFRF